MPPESVQPRNHDGGTITDAIQAARFGEQRLVLRAIIAPAGEDVTVLGRNHPTSLAGGVAAGRPRLGVWVQVGIRLRMTGTNYCGIRSTWPG
jgi:hypothetical protein